MSETVQFKRIRVEETPPAAPTPAVTVTAGSKDLEYWRTLAITTGERLSQSEGTRVAQAAQLAQRDKTLDELRARLEKSQGRKDTAQTRINELQVQLVNVSAERDELRAALASQEALRRKVYEYRQSLLEGPLWELFVELSGTQVTGGRQ